MLAQQQTMQNPQGQKIMLIGYMIIFGLVLWVTMIGPQRKKAKEQDLMMKSLHAGDKIVTTSGIIGVVLSIKEKSLSIRSAETKLEILKSAVSEVTEHGGEPSESKS